MPEPLNEIKKAFDELKTNCIEKMTVLEKKQGTDAETIQSKIAEMQKAFDVKMTEIEKQLQSRNLSLPGVDEMKEKFSFSKAILAMSSRDWSDAGFEREVFDNMRTKAANQHTGSGAAGGFLVPEELSSQIIDLAIANMPIFQMGITRLPGLVGDLAIPKITARQTGYNVAENGTATASGVTTDLRYLRPKRIAAYTKVSKRLLRQTRNVAEMIVRNELAKAINLKWHRQLIDGSGAENQIKGIVNFSSLTSTTAIGSTTLSVKSAASMIKAIDAANMLNNAGSYGFLVHTNTKWTMKNERVAQYSGDTSGMPILIGSPIMSDSQLESALGYMLRSTTDIPTTTAIFGDWAQVWLGMWEGMEIKVSDLVADATDNAFTQDLLFILAQIETDMTIADEAGLTKITDIVDA